MDPVCLWVVRDGVMTIYANGIEVARFKRDLWPHMMVDLAQALKIPVEIPSRTRTSAGHFLDPDTPLG